MIITTTGFFNTGSSAITHIIKEFDGVFLADDVYEIRILYDPDAIDDLRYHLIDCPHRQNSSFALKRFLRYIEYNSNKMTNHHYEKICNGHFKEISLDYIKAITLFSFASNSHIEAYEKGKFFTFLNRIYQRLVRSIHKRFKIRIAKDTLVSGKTIQYATTYDSSLFLKITKEYVKKILNYCNKNKGKYTLVDQLFPPSNFERYVDYLPNEDLVVFVVDRDPRDLFVVCKYFLKTKAIPCKNPKEFCEWFKWTRGQSFAKKDPNFVHRVRFEDLIYNYEESRKEIAKICGLDLKKCSRIGQFFNPNLSINNTQVWHKYPKSINEVEYIYNELKDYCFDFDKYSKKPNLSKKDMFDC